MKTERADLIILIANKIDFKVKCYKQKIAILLTNERKSARGKGNQPYWVHMHFTTSHKAYRKNLRQLKGTHKSVIIL